MNYGKEGVVTYRDSVRVLIIVVVFIAAVITETQY
jgi:hypothetical protein